MLPNGTTQAAVPSPGTDELVPGAQQAVAQMGGQQYAPAPRQAMVEEAPQDIGASPEQDVMDLRRITESVNIAEELDEDTLIEIGHRCKEGLESDEASRASYIQDVEDWLALANQTREEKNFPWANAANVKYPLMGIAAMQFSARAYPSLLPANGQYVTAKVFGEDPDGQLNERAIRVQRYMSYQLAVEMEDWEEDMDHLLMQLSITGNMYKKTWFDPSIKRIRSESISVADLVVNYWAKSLETAERISHMFRLYRRQVKNLQKQGVYLDCDLPLTGETTEDFSHEDTEADYRVQPYTIVEQHCYLDLDDDGYEEPYIVTFEKTSAKVLRIVANFDFSKEKIHTDAKGKIVYIEPNQYFTKYGFIPNPNGSFYDIGFGHLLGPLNENVNTIINQLTDAGTLSNLQSGFIGKSLRVRGGDYNFRPGEWKWVTSVVDDLKKQVMPLPTKEPSQTLLKLLELLIQSGKELASVAEIFVGKMPGQNTPATTTMASIEQGMKVFTAIYKRIYRALSKEYLKIFKLNHSFMEKGAQSAVLNKPIGPADFDISVMRILPSADPSASSQQERLAKAQALIELLPLGTINPMEATKRLVEAMEQPDLNKLLMPPQPEKPDPAAELANAKMQEMQEKRSLEREKHDQKMQQTEQDHQLKMASEQTKAAMEQQKQASDLAFEQERNRLNQAADRAKQDIFIRGEEAKLQVQKKKDAQKESSKSKK